LFRCSAAPLTTDLLPGITQVTAAYCRQQTNAYTRHAQLGLAQASMLHGRHVMVVT